MNSTAKRTGISLLEVLISIAVISLGIFGVASLIPLAQIKVAEGTSLDRQAALGPSAVAEFRIRRMHAPETWLMDPPLTAPELAKGLPSRAVLIDPLGYWGGAAPQKFFPASSTGRWKIPRYTLKSIPNYALAQRVFYLQDDIDFDRPADQTLQPRRKYFIDSATNRPLASAPDASLTWFATLSPFTALSNFATDEFLLSIVLCDGRVPELATSEEYEAQARGGTFPGELWIQGEPFVGDLQIGDWVLVGKYGTDKDPPQANIPGPTDFQAKIVYRWVKIIGVSDVEDQTRRTFVISNNDFLQPGEQARAFYIKGIESVFERTIRLDNTTTSWN